MRDKEKLKKWTYTFFKNNKCNSIAVGLRMTIKTLKKKIIYATIQRRCIRLNMHSQHASKRHSKNTDHAV